MGLAQSGHELLAVDDEAGVLALADEALFVGGRDGKLQLTALYLGERGGGGDGAPMGGGLEVRGGDVSANGRLTLLQVGCHASHCSLFHQGYHGGGGEYAQVSATDMSGQVMLLDGAGAGVGEFGV